MGGPTGKSSRSNSTCVKKVVSKASYMVIHEQDFMSEMVAQVQRDVNTAYDLLLAKID